MLFCSRYYQGAWKFQAASPTCIASIPRIRCKVMWTSMRFLSVFHTKMMQSICFCGNIQGTPEFTIFSFSDIKVSGFSHCDTPVSCQQSPCFPSATWFDPLSHLVVKELSAITCLMFTPSFSTPLPRWYFYFHGEIMLQSSRCYMILQGLSIFVNSTVWFENMELTCAPVYMIGAHNLKSCLPFIPTKRGATNY